MERAAGKDLGMGGICDIEESRRGGLPGLPPPKELLTKGFPCGFVGGSVGGGAEERGPGDGDPEIDSGAHPLFAGGFCLDGGEGSVGCLAILGG